MLRWFLMGVAVTFALLGSLTIYKSPDWSKWEFALFAAEFGYIVAAVPLVIGLVAWWSRGAHGTFAVGIVLVSVTATGLLLKPVVQAWWIARTLPDKLVRDLGPAEVARPPFSWARLWPARPPVIAPQTLYYSGTLALDFYPAVGRAAAPCVVLVHGGGWDNGTRTEIQHFDHWLAGRGYAVAAISYRLAPGSIWPAQRDDLRAAISYIKAHAAALGIDATRLVVFGRSAGGNIAEATAYESDDPAIRGVIALYAPADVNFAWAFARDDDVLKSPQLLKQFLGGPPATAQAAYDSASAIRHVGPKTPPTLLMHGELDTLVWNQQSIRLEKVLRDAGVRHAFVSLPWATHAFEYNLNGPGGQLATYSIEWFLQVVTK